MSNQRVFVCALDRQKVWAMSPQEFDHTYCGRRHHHAPVVRNLITDRETDFEAHTINIIPISKGSRKVDVILKGSIDTKTVDARVATVTIPWDVMVRRLCGQYKEMYVTTDRCPSSQCCHDC
ncbi:hypothetical protein DL546_007292 [Coniochaeta pulveracea]|uniref:Uncharacterized protein n=1 Tax=Coniochaeta pulveracea TaxID=177199 RepID=A0A420YA45_9PEZI|nr:hypothetical protein DL546_007292 [Coniochaeta pulveracea]